ncbi:MAG: hypothetical protein QXJ17_04395 [Nitrososphaeria archaeon]
MPRVVKIELPERYKKKVTGFFTDEEKRVRPITKATGLQELKERRKEILSKVEEPTENLEQRNKVIEEDVGFKHTPRDHKFKLDAQRLNSLYSVLSYADKNTGHARLKLYKDKLVLFNRDPSSVSFSFTEIPISNEVGEGAKSDFEIDSVRPIKEIIRRNKNEPGVNWEFDLIRDTDNPGDYLLRMELRNKGIKKEFRFPLHPVDEENDFVREDGIVLNVVKKRLEGEKKAELVVTHRDLKEAIEAAKGRDPLLVLKADKAGQPILEARAYEEGRWENDKWVEGRYVTKATKILDGPYYGPEIAFNAKLMKDAVTSLNSSAYNIKLTDTFMAIEPASKETAITQVCIAKMEQ